MAKWNRQTGIMATPKTSLDEAEQRLRNAVAEFQAAPARALEARDAVIREVAEEGLRQVDIIRITGYSRETVRQALNPEIRAAMKKAADERRAQKDAK